MITLPFPPSSLSGHNKGHWSAKSKVVKQYREWAFLATKANMPVIPDKGDIHILFRFIPPDRRGDRTNFPNRLKPIIDGIADALGVNDRRFLPSYQFLPPEKPGRVEVYISSGDSPMPAPAIFPFAGHRSLADIEGVISDDRS